MANSWVNNAACRGADIDMFFQEKGGGPHAYKEARQICGQCTVMQQCFEYIMGIEIDPAVPRFGFFAGMTPSQRGAYQTHLEKHVPAA